MTQSPHDATFRDSLERCLGQPTFTQRFYARFLLASDEVADRFAQVDLKRQASVLRSSLYLVLRASMGHEDGRDHLEDVAVKHGRMGLDIPSHLYDHWLECLIAAARECDPQFHAGYEASWRAVLLPCIDIVRRPRP